MLFHIPTRREGNHGQADGALAQGLMSYHPPLQTFGILFFAQGVLTLQPTYTKPDKARGLAFHQVFQIAGLALSRQLD